MSPRHDMPSYDAIIFDMDGVLIDSEPLHEKAQRVVFREYDLDVPTSAFREFKGQSEAAVFSLVAARYARGTIDAETLVARKHAVYDALQQELQPVAGALSVLERLAASGILLGLTTSATPANQAFAFERFRLDRYFKAVVTAADVARPKPDPEPYETTARRLGVAPSACLVIEDSTHGVTSATRAGCAVLGLTTSFPPEALRAAGAFATADTFDDVARHLHLS